MSGPIRSSTASSTSGACTISSTHGNSRCGLKLLVVQQEQAFVVEFVGRVFGNVVVFFVEDAAARNGTAPRQRIIIVAASARDPLPDLADPRNRHIMCALKTPCRRRLRPNLPQRPTDHK